MAISIEALGFSLFFTSDTELDKGTLKKGEKSLKVSVEKLPVDPKEREAALKLILIWLCGNDPAKAELSTFGGMQMANYQTAFGRFSIN